MDNILLLKKCPLSNLDIETYKHWDYKTVNCSFSVGILKNKIILSYTSGKLKIKDTIVFCNIINEIIDKYSSPDNKLILINNFKNLKYAPINSRRYYIDFFEKNQNSFQSVIYHNVSPFFKLSITITKKLYNFNIAVEVFKNYKTSLKYINDKYNLDIELKRAKLNEDVFCKDSGLKITENTDWNIFDSDKQFPAEFKFIGKNILFSTPKGNANSNNLSEYFMQRKKVLDSFLLPNEPFLEICDYSKLTGTPSKYFRIQFIENMNKDSQRIIGFIAFNTTLLLKLNLKVIFKIYKASFYVSIEKNYRNAILQAMEYSERESILTDKNGLNITSRTDWTLDLKNFQKTTEIIGNNILHTILSGMYKAEYSNSMFNLNEKVISEFFFEKRNYFFISGLRNLKSLNSNNTKTFLNSLKQFYLKHPFAILIIYGLDKRKKNIIDLLIPQFPFKIKFADDLSQGIKIIEEYKINSGEFLKPQLASDNNLEKYKDEILSFIGSLNWEFKEVDKSHEFNFSHPFIDVFNAISLVKSDMDLLIADNKKKEEELDSSMQATEEANRIKSNFLSNVSHEIRTPINGIIGATDLLKNSFSSSKKQKDLINIINYSSSKLLELVDDILNINKLEYSRIDIVKKPFSIKKLIMKIENNFKDQIDNKKIKLSINIDTDIPEILIGDSANLIQILQKILGNAIKFTKKGEINIIINRYKNKKRKRKIFIEFIIKDTGIGIANKYLKNIFVPFSQEDTSLQRNYGGSGLGLSIVKKIVEHIDGKISVVSKLGEGTEFNIILPFEFYIEENHMNLELTEIEMRNVGILIVEDNVINQKLAANMISKRGFYYKIAENGKEAINLLKTEEFDLVLMDIQMPIMNGLETTKFIRDENSSVLNKNIPIIAFTAHAMVGDREKYINAGMNDYISKPFKYVELIEVIERNLK